MLYIHFIMHKKTSGFKKILLLALLVVLGVSLWNAQKAGLAFFSTTLNPPSSGSSGASRARDYQRQSDLVQLATALELYVTETGEGYPNSSGCIRSAWNRAGFDYSSYLSILPTDPTDLLSSAVVTGACNIVSGGGYGYIPLNTDTTNSGAEGYLLVSRLESTSITGDHIYYNTSAWTPTTTGAHATAAYNLGAATVCTSTTAACTSAVHRYYMIGR